MAIPSTMRRLVQVTTGGTIGPNYAAGKPWRLMFTQPQRFYRGEIVFTNGLYDENAVAVSSAFTIAYGDGNTWHAHQHCLPNNYGSYSSSPSWWRSDPDPTKRLRGPGGASLPGMVPGAEHFLYVSLVDGAGALDWYTYVDTVFPINGRHPYTRDQWSGRSWFCKEDYPWKAGTLVPDTASRIAALDALPPVLRA